MNIIKLFFAGFLGTSLLSTAHALNNPICASEAECRDMIKQAQIRLQILNSPPDVRITTTGAVFTLDSTNPELGVAFRDPSDMIWGDAVTVMKQGYPTLVLMTQAKAIDYCNSKGARLPTKSDFDKLQNYFGAGTPFYSRAYYNAKNEYSSFLPNLPSAKFWTQTISPHNAFSAYIINLDRENNFEIRDLKMEYPVRCVAN